jgi:hypothetical protein
VLIRRKKTRLTPMRIDFFTGSRGDEVEAGRRRDVLEIMNFLQQKCFKDKINASSIEFWFLYPAILYLSVDNIFKSYL